ncbi:hypothetical protein LCGC14_2685600, partial [marine sediment metagenome]
ATGSLTAEEIEQLHKKFKSKVHDMTVAWRKDYRIKTQVQRAKMSTTEWYEKTVSKTLFGNIWFELLGPSQHYPGSAQVWHHAYTGQYGWGRRPRWGDLPSAGMLQGKIRELKATAAGSWSYAGGRGKDGRGIHKHPAWPGPNAEQAKAIGQRLRHLHDGSFTRRYPRESWDWVVTGATKSPRMTFGVVTDFYPHRRREMMDQYVTPLKGLWAAALKAAEDYVAAAEGGADAVGLTRARDACLAAVKAVAAKAAPLVPPNAADCRKINWAIRVDVILGGREKMYDYWVDRMVADLAPMVREFARGQFKKGIIVHSQGVDQAMKEFPDQVMPLLRRDVLKMFPRKVFDVRIHHTGNAFKRDAYRSKLLGKWRAPNEQDRRAELAEMEKIIAKWGDEGRAYAKCRREILARRFEDAVDATIEGILTLTLTGNLLLRDMDAFV